MGDVPSEPGRGMLERRPVLPDGGEHDLAWV